MKKPLKIIIPTLAFLLVILAGVYYWYVILPVSIRGDIVITDGVVLASSQYCFKEGFRHRPVEKRVYPKKEYARRTIGWWDGTTSVLVQVCKHIGLYLHKFLPG